MACESEESISQYMLSSNNYSLSLYLPSTFWTTKFYFAAVNVFVALLFSNLLFFSLTENTQYRLKYFHSTGLSSPDYIML